MDRPHPAELPNDQLDDLVSEWHANAINHRHPSFGIPLHDWLGMTWQDYGRWVTDSSYRPPRDAS